MNPQFLLALVVMLLASCRGLPATVSPDQSADLLTPVPQFVDWGRGERIAVQSNTQGRIGALAIGAGNFMLDEKGWSAIFLQKASTLKAVALRLTLALSNGGVT